METMNFDSIRGYIFKEFMTLDKNNLQKLYAYILTLTKRKETVEVTLLEEMLDANAEYALKAHERGDVYTIEDVRNYIEEQLGWR